MEPGGWSLRLFGDDGVLGHGLLRGGLPILLALSEALPQSDEETRARGLCFRGLGSAWIGTGGV